MFDPTTNQHSTTSFLLYLTNVEDGGATVFLAGGRWGQGDAPPVVMGTRAEKKAEQVAGNGAGGVAEAAPRVGSILVFPHLAPHEGLPVWDEPKILLRGDCY